jgi:large subunit ribosomal protein L4e
MIRREKKQYESATIQKNIVQLRGHKIPQNYPFIISSEIEKLNKTIEVQKTLESLGFAEELERTSEKKIRAGKGKSRGRPYERKKGLLLVVGGNCELLKSAKNIEEPDIVEAKKVNAELLAPGANPGRATLFTQNAITQIEKEKLFI